jgi:hypothetical protein
MESKITIFLCIVFARQFIYINNNIKPMNREVAVTVPVVQHPASEDNIIHHNSNTNISPPSIPIMYYLSRTLKSAFSFQNVIQNGNRISFLKIETFNKKHRDQIELIQLLHKAVNIKTNS